ncbi:MAG: hypothetical protein M1433_00360 [Candidatus Parvarchaeota archaeon]|nr:hypothetical protein [Candidatus Parvarchaeota archaeon]
MFGFNIKNYEKEFDTDKLESHHVFYDLYIKSNDPQELRNGVSESMTDMDYKILLNEMSKFDDSELEETFRGGNSKPIRVVIKSLKDNVKGSRFPILWKVCAVLAVLLLVASFALYSNQIYTNLTSFKDQTSAYILYGMIVFFVFTIIFLAIKKVVPIFLWAKIIGIYDPTEQSANVRVVLSGDCEVKDKDSYSKLENDMSELYSELSRKYANKLDKRQMSSTVASATGNQGSQRINDKLREIENKSGQLERDFTTGKISKSEYESTKASLESKKTQLEALFDLLNG